MCSVKELERSIGDVVHSVNKLGRSKFSDNVCSRKDLERSIGNVVCSV